MKWSITIDKVDNGYILETNDGEDINKEVVEVEDNDEEGKKAMTALLHKISEYFGIMYDGFSKENLNIKWDEKGDEV